jgi:hypothetical protein
MAWIFFYCIYEHIDFLLATRLLENWAFNDQNTIPNLYRTQLEEHANICQHNGVPEYFSKVKQQSLNAQFPSERVYEIIFRGLLNHLISSD